MQTQQAPNFHPRVNRLDSWHRFSAAHTAATLHMPSCFTIAQCPAIMSTALHTYIAGHATWNAI